MKAMIVLVFASFLFISMSFKVNAEDPYQVVSPNLNPSEDVHQPAGQLSRPMTNYLPGKGQAVENKSGKETPVALFLKHQRKRLQNVAAKGQPTTWGKPSADKSRALSVIKFRANRDKEKKMIREIRKLMASKTHTSMQKMVLEKLRRDLKKLRTEAVIHKQYLLAEFYGKYFSKDDNKIEFKVPTNPLKNCILQAMIDPSFSPSCKSNRTYSAKQCTKKRCWCSTRRGAMLYKQKQGHYRGLHGNGFYYGIKGVTLRCPPN